MSNWEGKFITGEDVRSFAASSHSVKLKQMNACSEAIEWAENYPSLKKAWDACERGDWMLWLLGETNKRLGTKKHRLIVRCAVNCARLSLKHVKRGEDRPRIALEVTERWLNNDIDTTIGDVSGAAHAAYAACAAASAAADAAYAACAAHAAADAADAAHADIVRKYFPNPPKI